ncbi:MAG: hypothetical protein AB2L24_05925 [Mangrovibacterium sp.]
MFDLSSLDFVHPFLILPVAALVVNAMETGNFFGFERCKTDYLEKLAFPSGVLSKDKIEPGKLMDQYRTKTYLPVCAFPSGLDSKAKELRDSLLESFNGLLAYKLKLKGVMR